VQISAQGAINVTRNYDEGEIMCFGTYLLNWIQTLSTTRLIELSF